MIDLESHPRMVMALSLFSREGVLGSARTVIDHLLLNTALFAVYLRYRYLLCVLTQRKAASHPYKVIWVRTDEIEYWKPNHDRYDLPEFGLSHSPLNAHDVHVWKDGGKVVGGDWDRSEDLIEIEKMPKYQGIRDHFVDGVPWEETELFDVLMEIIERRGAIDGCTCREDLEERYASIDDLYRQIDRNGYKLARDVDTSRNVKAPYDEVGVVIGRDGEILFQGGGWHRISIAKILDIERIPVRVIARHRKWQEVREEIAYCDDRDDLGERARAHVSHPDVQELLVRTNRGSGIARVSRPERQRLQN